MKGHTDIMKSLPLSSTNDPWYLIHCQARKEAYAANVLRSILEISVYLPECKVRARGGIRHVPFFPGYLFAQIDLARVTPSRINSSPGVLRLVDFGGDPQSVPRQVVEELAERVKHVDMLNVPSFLPGDAVRVKNDGPLQGLDMIFVGPTAPGKRVCVLLNFLGRLKEVNLDREALEKVPHQANGYRRLMPHHQPEQHEYEKEIHYVIH